MITLGQREIDNINRMITISDRLLIQSACLWVIWDLLNLGQFDHINIISDYIQRLTLYYHLVNGISPKVITLSGLHCISLISSNNFVDG